MAPRVGVVVFPGTNCELDAAYALEHAGAEAVTLFHADTDLQGVDGISRDLALEIYRALN